MLRYCYRLHLANQAGQAIPSLERVCFVLSAYGVFPTGIRPTVEHMSYYLI